MTTRFAMKKKRYKQRAKKQCHNDDRPHQQKRDCCCCCCCCCCLSKDNDHAKQETKQRILNPDRLRTLSSLNLGHHQTIGRCSCRQRCFYHNQHSSASFQRNRSSLVKRWGRASRQTRWWLSEQLPVSGYRIGQ